MKFLDNNTLKVILLVLLIALAIGVGPLITIWSLNTLFTLNIAYNFWTWLATICLGGYFYNSRSKD